MHILVVDDSKTIRFMMIRLLNELGYNNIAEAVDVESAMLQIRKAPPDLIFSDYNMPGKNGLDFLKAVRQHPTIGQVPFIMATTVHDKNIILDAVKSGLQHYLFKPVEKHLLVEKLATLAKTYNFQEPKKTESSHWMPIPEEPKVEAQGKTDKPHQASEKDGAQTANSEPPKQKQSISPEQIKAIIEHFYLLFDGEITMQDFQTWATEDCLPHLPQNCKIKSSQEFLSLLRSAATQGIQAALEKCNA